jgi:4-hydroxybenzoate polyprenyltransferase
MNEILQWLAILVIAFLMFYPVAKTIVQDFKEAEDDE